MKVLNKRPYDSGILAMGSGALILAIGIIAIRGFFDVGDQSVLELIAILIGTLSGAGIIATGAVLLIFPDRHRILGAITMVLSVTSFAGTSGGLYIGAIGGLLGGIMSISWHSKNGVQRKQNESSHNN